MALSKTKNLHRVTIFLTEEIIEISWIVRFFEDDIEESLKVVTKSYNEDSSSQLDSDVPAGVANKLKNIFNWT
jgi:hypothetical protein